MHLNAPRNAIIRYWPAVRNSPLAGHSPVAQRTTALVCQQLLLTSLLRLLSMQHLTLSAM